MQVFQAARLKVYHLWISLLFCSLTCILGPIDLFAEQFSDEEIRIIRPRYFEKKSRFELGLQLLTVINQSFVYTMMAAPYLGYHINEQWSIELGGAFGGEFDKESKLILEQDFGVKSQTSILRYFVGVTGQWTPMYGKYALSSGELIYFDSFLSLGVGASGVEHLYNHCSAGRDSSGEPILRSSTVYTYPFLGMGLGQRYFVSKNSSLRWDLSARFTYANEADSECLPGQSDRVEYINTLALNLGYSLFY